MASEAVVTRRFILASAVLAAAAGGVWNAMRPAEGDALPAGPPAPDADSAGPPTTVPIPPAGTAAERASFASDELAADFAILRTRLGGQVGLAFAPQGSRTSVRMGDLPADWAWSTIKVPIAMAVARVQGGTSPRIRELVGEAIAESDNRATARLWRELGTSAQAASAVTAVLRDGGDRNTVVTEPAYGTTRWAVPDQAVFAANFPLLGGAEIVLQAMEAVRSDQRWGLGSVRLDVRYKGGWGQGEDGGYDVRQLGVVDAGDGTTVGVAITATAPDGIYLTGGRRW